MRNSIEKPANLGNSKFTSAVAGTIRDVAWHSKVFLVEPAESFGDNPLPDRLIVVGTKALGRELVSGETLRAPRQQLRQLRASAFEFVVPFQDFATNARLFGAHCFLEHLPIKRRRLNSEALLCDIRNFVTQPEKTQGRLNSQIEIPDSRNRDRFASSKWPR